MLKSAASSVSSSQEEFWNFSLTRLQFHLWQQNKKPRNTYFDLFIGKHQLDDRFTYLIDYSSTFARGAMSNPKAEYFCWTPILLYYCILRYVSNLNILVLYDSSFTACHTPVCSWHVLLPYPLTWPCRPKSSRIALAHCDRNGVVTTL